jgi:hypothetical protein
MNTNPWPQNFTGYGEGLEYDKAKSAALTDLMAYFGVEIDSKLDVSDNTDSVGGSSLQLEEKTTNRLKSFLLGAKVIYSCRGAEGWQMIVGVRKITAQKMFAEDLAEKIAHSRSFLRKFGRQHHRDATQKLLASSLHKRLSHAKTTFELASDSKSPRGPGNEELRKLADFMDHSGASVLQVTTSDDLAKSTFIDLANVMGKRNVWIETARSPDTADAIWRCSINYFPAFSGVMIFQGQCDLVLNGKLNKEIIYQAFFDGIAPIDKPEKVVESTCKRLINRQPSEGNL